MWYASDQISHVDNELTHTFEVAFSQRLVMSIKSMFFLIVRVPMGFSRNQFSGALMFTKASQIAENPAESRIAGESSGIIP